MNPITVGIITISLLFTILIAILILCIIMVYILSQPKVKDSKEKERDKKKMRFKYTAIIVETSEAPSLKFVLTNIVTNLSDEWGIVVCHGNRNIKYIQDIISTLPNRFFMKHVPVDSMNIQQYNTFLKSPFFFEYIPTEMFLIFQKDSMIIPRYKDKINDFMNYDYVGAPWKTPYLGKGNEVGNGSFSLRRKSKMVYILNHSKDTSSSEELFYSCPKDIRLSKPSSSEASLFSIETILVPHSFGCSKPWMYHEHDALFEMYPEIKELYMSQKK
jgi:hypothetical protein